MGENTDKNRDWHKLEWLKSGLAIDAYAEREGIPLDTIYKWSSANKWQDARKSFVRKSEDKAETRLAENRAGEIVKAQKRHLAVAQNLFVPALQSLQRIMKDVKNDKRTLTVYELLAAMRLSVAIEQSTLGLKAIDSTGAGGAELSATGIGRDLSQLTEEQLTQQHERFEKVIKEINEPTGDDGDKSG